MRFWPETNSSKEILFLNIIREIFEKYIPKIEESLSLKLGKRIVKSMSSDNVVVIDAALCLFEINNFLSYVNTVKNDMFPLLISISVYQLNNHWNSIIKNSFTSLSEIIRKIDPELFDKLNNDELIDESNPNLHQTKDKRRELDMKWSILSQVYQSDSIIT